jgi:UDP-N-acetyl-D-mannosaminuronate dehydrogenase
MATHFLEVGSMQEGVQEVLENAQWLRLLLNMTPDQRAALEQGRIAQGAMTSHTDDLQRVLAAITARCEEMIGFLDQFESAPVIYTGNGSTAEVLTMLERLMKSAR